MATLFSRFWSFIRRGRGEAAVLATGEGGNRPGSLRVEIDPGDALVAFFRAHADVTSIDELELDSPALAALKASGVTLIAPLISRGELVGLLNLGPRVSMQGYAPDDFLLLDTLINQAAPALRVAQLAELQKVEALKNQRVEHEIHMARLIQQTLLPKEVPVLPGWQIHRFYQPAHDVGGDFYDFVPLSDGRLALIIGDVTDKGMPAALLMATTRAMLRAAALHISAPGDVLAHVNEAICPDMPASMFVTCLYALLDPATGRLVFANAGHNLPYRFQGVDLEELRATGMPLGLLPGMRYEEREARLLPGDNLLLYTDGLVEAHNPQRGMFGNERLEALIHGYPSADEKLIQLLLAAMTEFSGPEWEQEDDVTLVTLVRERQENQGENDG